MGLLDDAIREHLELKRQSGADPGEIERLEQEALGPVRRTPQDAEDDLFGADEPSGPYGAEPASKSPVATSDEPDPFEDERDDEGFESAADFDDSAEFEPPTEIAPRPPLEPESDPGLRESALHHEIAEEWEAHQRQSLREENGGLESDDEIQSTPPQAPAAPRLDDDRLPPARREDPDLVEQETAEYRVEDEHAGDEAKGEDVLEETPEFLQDTPDHDRLWFEQRPPRDFDLDG